MTRRIATIFALALTACGGSAKQSPAPAAPTGEPVAEAPAAPAPAPAPPAPAFPADEFRGKRPEATAPRPLQLPGVTRFKLPPGIEVFLVERHELPKVELEITFPGGNTRDPKGKEGLNRLCMTLVGDSTQALDKVAYEEAKADLGSSISSAAASEELRVEMGTLTRNLDATLDLWADVLRKPGLRPEDHDRNVKRAIAQVQSGKGAAAPVSQRVRPTVYWGPNHPYGRIVTEKSLGAVTVDDCRKLAKDWLRPVGARLYVVGDITEAQLKEKLAKRFAGWTGKVKPEAVIPPPAPRAGGRVFFVDVPGSSQSVVAVGHAGPARQAKDYFPTYMMFDVLGGQFSSRINMNLREDKGWAYGAFGGVIYSRNRGLISIQAAVKTESTAPAIKELINEVVKMTESDVTDEELGRAKGGAIQGLPALFATGGEVLDAYRDLVYFKLPLTYYDKYVASVQAVDKPAVRKAATTHLKPKQLVVVVTGDGKTVLPELEKLAAEGGMGPIVKLDADGNVVK